jgi:hypothetical protein
MNVLTVEFGTPSYEFTVNLGNDFTYKLTVLPPTYNKFTLACRLRSMVCFLENESLKDDSYQVQKFDQGVLSEHKCKPNLLPEVVRTKVLRRNIPRTKMKRLEFIRQDTLS